MSNDHGFWKDRVKSEERGPGFTYYWAKTQPNLFAGGPTLKKAQKLPSDKKPELYRVLAHQEELSSVATARGQQLQPSALVMAAGSRSRPNKYLRLTRSTALPDHIRASSVGPAHDHQAALHSRRDRKHRHADKHKKFQSKSAPVSPANATSRPDTGFGGPSRPITGQSRPITGQSRPITGQTEAGKPVLTSLAYFQEDRLATGSKPPTPASASTGRQGSSRKLTPLASANDEQRRMYMLKTFYSTLPKRVPEDKLSTFYETLRQRKIYLN